MDKAESSSLYVTHLVKPYEIDVMIQANLGLTFHPHVLKDKRQVLFIVVFWSTICLTLSLAYISVQNSTGFMFSSMQRKSTLNEIKCFMHAICPIKQDIQ